ncbi:hypothetical protein GCM10028819_36480 [Spirosoma humi]
MEIQMNTLDTGIKLPLWKALSVLIGFPLLSYGLSLMLLHRTLFSFTGWDFFSVFWLLITGWYVLQIRIVISILASEGYTLADIGYTLDASRSKKLFVGYLLVSILLLILVEALLQSNSVDASRLSDFANLTPTSLRQRVIYISMGLAAGLSEEIVYRGFAIRSLIGYKLNKWVSVLVATIPFVFQHGLKAIPQFSWFFGMGLLFGILFMTTRQLTVGIIIHWLVILSAVLAILSSIN